MARLNSSQLFPLVCLAAMADSHPKPQLELSVGKENKRRDEKSHKIYSCQSTSNLMLLWFALLLFTWLLVLAPAQASQDSAYEQVAKEVSMNSGVGWPPREQRDEESSGRLQRRAVGRTTREIEIDAEHSSDSYNNETTPLLPISATAAMTANESQTTTIATTQQPAVPSEESMKFPLYMRMLATLTCVIIFTIGVCGNLLVPLVVIKTKYLRNSTNLFLINLSIADLLVLIVCMPTVLIELHSRPETWLLGESMCLGPNSAAAFAAAAAQEQQQQQQLANERQRNVWSTCKLSNFVEMLAANGSIFTILAISFERYYAICKPLKAGYKCTRLRATIIICIIWLLASLLTSPILIMAKSSQILYIDGSLVDNCILETDSYWPKMYVFVSMVAFFWLPLLVLMLVYWLISRRLIRENLAMMNLTTKTTAAPPASNCPLICDSNFKHKISNKNSAPICGLGGPVGQRGGGGGVAISKCGDRLGRGVASLKSLSSFFASRHNHYEKSETSDHSQIHNGSHYASEQSDGHCAFDGQKLSAAAKIDSVITTSNGGVAHERRRYGLLAGKALSLDNHHHHHPSYHHQQQQHKVLQGAQGIGGACKCAIAYPELPVEGEEDVRPFLRQQPTTVSCCPVDQQTGEAAVAVGGHRWACRQPTTSVPLASEKSGDSGQREEPSAGELIGEISGPNGDGGPDQTLNLTPAAATNCRVCTTSTVCGAHKSVAASEEFSLARIFSANQFLNQLLGRCKRRQSQQRAAAAATTTTCNCDSALANTHEGNEEKPVKEQEEEQGERWTWFGWPSRRAQQSRLAHYYYCNGFTGCLAHGRRCIRRAGHYSTTTTGSPSEAPTASQDSGCHRSMNSAHDAECPASGTGLSGTEALPSESRIIGGCKYAGQQLMDSNLASHKENLASEWHQVRHRQTLESKKGRRTPSANSSSGGSAGIKPKFKWVKGFSVSSSTGSTYTNSTILHSECDSSISPPQPAASNNSNSSSSSGCRGCYSRTGSAMNNHYHHHSAHINSMCSSGKGAPIDDVKAPNSIVHCPDGVGSGNGEITMEFNILPRQQRQANDSDGLRRNAHFCHNDEYRSPAPEMAAAICRLHDDISVSATTATDQSTAESASPSRSKSSSPDSVFNQVHRVASSRACSASPGARAQLSSGLDESRSDSSCSRLPEEEEAEEQEVECCRGDNERVVSDAHNKSIDLLTSRGSFNSSSPVRLANDPAAALQARLRGYSPRSLANRSSPSRCPSGGSPSPINRKIDHSSGKPNEGADESQAAEGITHEEGGSDSISDFQNFSRSNSATVDARRTLALGKRSSLETCKEEQNQEAKEAQTNPVVTDPCPKATIRPSDEPLFRAVERRPMSTQRQQQHNRSPLAGPHLRLGGVRSGSQPLVCSPYQHNHYHHHCQQQGNGATRSHQLSSDFVVVRDISKKQQMDSRRQVVLMLAFVVACFFLLFFPYRVFTIWLILSTEDQVQSLGMETYYNLTYFSRILIYLHSAINPIAYNLISTKFRRAFMSILLCRGSRTRRHFTTEKVVHHHQNHSQHFQQHQQLQSSTNRSLKNLNHNHNPQNCSSTAVSPSPNRGILANTSNGFGAPDKIER